MVTNALINTIKDERLSIENKRLYLQNLDFQYSDIFRLIDIFEYETSMDLLFLSFICFEDSKFIGKLDYKNRKQRTKEKERKMRMRRYNYDKYKRRQKFKRA